MNPQGSDRDLGVGRGQQRGELTIMGNGGRCRHVAQGAGAISGGWRVAGACDVQVGGALHLERRWGVGEKLEGFEDERLRMGRR